MNTTTKTRNPTPPTAARRNVRRALSAILHTTLDRMTVPYRDIPADFYRFPPF